MLIQNIGISAEILVAFSQRWHVHELAVFGSVLHDELRQASDIDLLVTFEDTAQWGLFALVEMQHELESIIGRPVDLISRRSIDQSTNWLRRETILQSATILYTANHVSETTYAA